MTSLRFDYQGKVALITGAANGIGKDMAQRFAASGATLVLVDKSEAVQALAASLGSRHLAAVQDVNDEAATDDLIEQAIERTRHKDLLNARLIKAASVPADLHWSASD